jgi:hypothetical protein
LERRRNWSFLVKEDETWFWRVADSTGTQESASFATLKDCTADATKHGYVAWRSEDERRRDLALGVTKALAREKTEE